MLGQAFLTALALGLALGCKANQDGKQCQGKSCPHVPIEDEISLIQAKAKLTMHREQAITGLAHNLSNEWWIQSNAQDGLNRGWGGFVSGRTFATPPVHENIMYKALDYGGYVNEVGLDSNTFYNTYLTPDTNDRPAPPVVLNDLLRGSTWPDDPVSYLYDDEHLWDKNVGGEYVVTMFGPCEGGDAKFKKTVHWPDNLLCHSHYGELQFFHGMSAKPAEPFEETQTKAKAFSHWLYEVALAKDIKETDGLKASMEKVLDGDEKEALVGAFATTLENDPGKFEELRVRDLFFMNDKGGPQPEFIEGVRRQVSHVALGALIHMMADSFAVGHSGRETTQELVNIGSHKNFHVLGPVMQFRDYTQQGQTKATENLHSNYDLYPFQGIDCGKKDECPHDSGDSVRDNVIKAKADYGKSTYAMNQWHSKQMGFNSAVYYGLTIVKAWMAGAPWASVSAHRPRATFNWIYKRSVNAVPAAGGQVLYKFEVTEGIASNCQLCWYPVVSPTDKPLKGLKSDQVKLATSEGDTPQCARVSPNCEPLWEADYGCLNAATLRYEASRSKGASVEVSVSTEAEDQTVSPICGANTRTWTTKFGAK